MVHPPVELTDDVVSVNAYLSISVIVTAGVRD